MKIFKTNYFKLTISLLVILLITSMGFETITSADVFSGGRKDNSKPSAHNHLSVNQYGYSSHYDRGRAYWNAHSNVNIKKSNNSVSLSDTYYIGNTSVAGMLGRIIPYNASGMVHHRQVNETTHIKIKIPIYSE